MPCETWKTKFDRYLDRELPPEDMRAFDSHVRACSECAADALAQMNMKHSIRAAGATRFTPTAEFRSRIQRSIAAKPRRSPIAFGWTMATALAAILAVVGLAVVYTGEQRARSQRLYSEVIDLHVSTLASSSPVDVLSTDRHTVKPWFQGKIPFTFDLPELQNSGFSLLGGRVTYLDQTPGAELIYELRKHRISVFIFPEQSLQNRLGGNVPTTKNLSFNRESWSRGGLYYFVIGDASAADVKELSNLFQTSS
jgi:anti-sigma factor RsiW